MNKAFLLTLIFGIAVQSQFAVAHKISPQDTVQRRLAMSNNIRGNQVTTNQKILELNGVTSDFVNQYDQDASQVPRQDLEMDSEEPQKYSDVQQKPNTIPDDLLWGAGSKNPHQHVGIISEDPQKDSNVQQKSQIERNDDIFWGAGSKNPHQHVGIVSEEPQKNSDVQHKPDTIPDDIFWESVINPHQHEGINSEKSQKNSDVQQKLKMAEISSLLAELYPDVYKDVMRRITISNDIEGTVVNTNQKLEEHNSRRSMGSQNADNTEDVLTSFRRNIQLQNNIKGKNVETDQIVKEKNSRRSFSDINTPLHQRASSNHDQKINVANRRMQMKRIELSNNIQGNMLNTNQKVTEINRYQPWNRRLSLQNNIAGDVVKTNTTVHEINGVVGAEGEEQETQPEGENREQQAELERQKILNLLAETNFFLENLEALHEKLMNAMIGISNLTKDTINVRRFWKLVQDNCL